MVRLKVPFSHLSSLVLFISIPYGSIKSFLSFLFEVLQHYFNSLWFD